MKEHLLKRLLSWVLVVVLCLGTVLPAAAAGTSSDYKVTFEQVDNSAVSAKPSGLETVVEKEQPPLYEDTEVVRVSIVLSDKSTIETVGTTENLDTNVKARRYRSELAAKQTARTNAISSAIGGELDVVWNLTLAANMISANVEYGQIAAIKKVPGVEDVLIETRYEPAVVDTDLPADPNMATSSAQIGSAAAWAAGYTGAGSRIAVIDTGIDTDHQSFSEEGYAYALACNAEKAGMSLEDYKASLKLMDASKTADVWSQLNASKRGSFSAEQTYVSSKIPFGFNYVDSSLDVTHDNDRQGEHGSHVEGIAAANAYIPKGDGTFEHALDSVHVQGVAPDAQLIVMKVFGRRGGAYDSDYMVAIEDAMMLGADSVNLSLGASSPGRTAHSTARYQGIMESLSKCGTVVTISTGNAGSWVENAVNGGRLYAQDVSMHMSGEPGTFANSLAVASVENDGYTGYYMTVGERPVFYEESYGYSNKPLTTLAGQQSYILIDGYGDYSDWAAVGGAVLRGKIAICSRGGGINFSDKANAAANYSALGMIIYNNEPGTFGMDLSDCWSDAPCVSITQADGAWMKAAATPVTDSEGNVIYYEGVLNIGKSYGSVNYNSEYQTMSSFSSWGVPGDLLMKPEITAPGGNIYSVNGAAPGGKAYETMSGTSMAAPQVAGMVAVAAQYIREEGLAEKTGRSVRQLAQSLLMSTAIPLREGASGGEYYPVLRQGAGLANVSAAVSAGSYIWMDETATASANDGKIKVELGDDPARSGKYTVSFSIHNLTDEAQLYDLAADLFTQDLFTGEVNQNGDMGDFMSTMTRPLRAAVTWTVDGKTVTPEGESLANMDFNGDGKVNGADCTALLDYITGLREEIKNGEHADLDADGDIDSYDAYLFLNRVSTGAVTVPAAGAVQVTATLELTEDQKAELNEKYVNGAYVEGFVYAKAITTAEGEKGTTHSIPVLGFYGNWSDPSMFDVGSRPLYRSGEEVRTPYLGDYSGNTYVLKHEGVSGGYYFGGNPYVPDDSYMPERNAINGENGDEIYSVNFVSIRNASDSRHAAFNETTNESMGTEVYGPGPCAYYYVQYRAWQNTGYIIPLHFKPTGAKEGDRLRLDWTLAPDYYVDENGTNWNALGRGCTFSVPMIVDNTAPELKGVALNLVDNTLDVTASDNQYVAAAILYNSRGTRELSTVGAKQEIQPGETAVYSLDLTDVNGKDLLLQVYDYAMNAVTYRIEIQIGEVVPPPEMFAFDLDKNFWFTFTEKSNYDLEAHTEMDLPFYAATIADHMVFASTKTGDLYVMSQDSLGELDGFEDLTLIGNMGTVLTDMAYNKADGKIYGVNESGYLVAVDRLTAEVEEIGKIGIETNTLACDSEGVFYCNRYGSKDLYSFTLDTVSAPQHLLTVDNLGQGTEFVQSMEINPNTGKLCWFSYYAFVFSDYKFGHSFYYEIDTKTKEYTKYNDFWDEMTCLIIRDKSSTGGGDWTKPTNEVSGIQITKDAVALYRNGTVQLSASVQPWTATDRTVTWSTDNPEVATVSENGLVTAVNAGNCTISVVSNLDPTKRAECKVRVNAVDITLKGLLQDEEANSKFFTWNMKDEPTWTAGVGVDTSLTSAAYDPLNDDLYVMDAVSNNWAVHRIDMNTGVTLEYGLNQTGVPLWDMEYSQKFSTKDKPLMAGVYYIYFMVPQNPMNVQISYIDLSAKLSGAGAQYLVAVASLGEAEIQMGYYTYDTERFVLLDDAGNLWNLAVYLEGGEYNALINRYNTNLKEAPVGDGESMLCSLVADEKGNLYYSVYNDQQGTSNLYILTLDDAHSIAWADYIGNMGQDIWPAPLYAAVSNTGDGRTADCTMADAEIVHAVNGPALQLADDGAVWKEAGNRCKDTARLARGNAQDAPAEEAPGPVTGSLNAVVTTGKSPVRPMSDTDVTDSEDTVTLHVTAKNGEGADVASHNGELTVNYDSNVFALKSTTVHAAYSSCNDTADGKVVIAYADTAEIPAGDYVATLVLERKANGAGSVSVLHEQVNDQNPGYEELVPIDYSENPDDHTETELVGAKEPTWTEPGYTGDVVCVKCGTVLKKGFVIPATGTVIGVIGGAVAGPSKPTAPMPFTDVGLGDWFYDDVKYVYENGLMNGTSDSKFSPYSTLTRAMVVTVLYRIEGEPATRYNGAFSDVANYEWYTDAVEWAAKNEIVTGYTTGKFGPNDSVTREQLAAILYRYAQLKGYDVAGSDSLSGCADSATVSAYAVPAVKWAVDGDMLLTTNGKLRPREAANRAEVAAAMASFYAAYVE